MLCPFFSKLFMLLLINEKKIVIDNFTGKGYGDNPKYIAEELLGKGYDIIWLVDNLSNYRFPIGIRPVKIHSIKGLYSRATAKVWIDNVRHYHPIKKKRKQVYLQTWHGSFSVKLIEKDAEAFLDKKYIKEAQYDGTISDAILASGKLEEDLYRRAFWLTPEVEILKFGLPRNDELVIRGKCKNVIRKLRHKLGFQLNAYYVLYAPTFRDDFSTEAYNLDFSGVIRTFIAVKKCDCYLIVRLHPNIAQKADIIEYTDHIINGTKFTDIQDLIIASDCVISDYSSIPFDFEMIQKPAFLYCSDLEKYEKTRGLLKEFYKYPFPLARTNREMLNNIQKFNETEYRKKMEEYMEGYPSYENGHAAKKTAEWIEKKIRS